MSYKIVRTENAGVFAGTVDSVDDINRTVAMSNSRRLWYWDGAATLSQLAMTGTSKPKDCKFPCAEKLKRVYQVIEIIDCTEEARKSIESVPVWSA